MCATLLAWIESGRIDRHNLRIVHVRRKLEPAVRSAMSFQSVRNFCDGTEEGVRKMLARYDELAQWHVDELKLPTFAFDYEQLIREPETVVRQIAEFLGVTNPAQIRRATRIIGKGKGMIALQLERYLILRSAENLLPINGPQRRRLASRREVIGHLGPCDFAAMDFEVFLVDPVIGPLHAVAEPDAGRPAEILLDQRVVAVAAVHALGR